MRSADDPEKLQGLHINGGLVLDEAGLMSPGIWDVARQRTNAHASPILITSTPYGFNWLYHSLVVPYLNGDENIDLAPPLLNCLRHRGDSGIVYCASRAKSAPPAYAEHASRPVPTPGW